MASEIIKEFLVGLGFKVDQSSLVKFKTGIGEADKLAAGLTATVAAATASITALVRTFSDEMTKLYYSSQRSGATVNNLQTLGQAARGIGIDFGRMTSIVEGFGRTLRGQPGLTGFLKNLGIDPKGKDNAVVLIELLNKLRAMGKPGSMGYTVAQQIAGHFGISPDDFLQLTQNMDRYNKMIADFARRRKDAGLDTERSTADAVKFSETWTRVSQNFSIAGQQIYDTFVGPLTKVLEWVEQFQEFFARANKESGGEIGVWTTVIGSGLAFVAAKAGLARIGLAGVAAEAGAASAAAGGFLATMLRYGAGAGAFLYGMQAKPLNKGEDEVVADLWKNHPGGKPDNTVKEDPSLPLGIRQNNPGNLRNWKGADRRNGFAAFPTATAGLSAMAKNLLNYFDNGVRTIRDIVNLWAPSSDGNNVAAYIGSLVKQTGFAENDQLNLRDPDSLQKIMTAMIKHENGQQPYSPELIRAAINGRLGLATGALVPGEGGGGASVTQTTNITVNGATDPKATGKSVEEAVRNANSENARNLRAILR